MPFLAGFDTIHINGLRDEMTSNLGQYQGHINIFDIIAYINDPGYNSSGWRMNRLVVYRTDGTPCTVLR